MKTQSARTDAMPAEAPLVSVVVCTRNRPAGAAAVLRDLSRLVYPNFEIVLVDNAPSDDSTKDIVKSDFGDDPRIRYVTEPRPGLSKARNRGWKEARGDIIAYTDDDVLVDSYWLNGVVKGFHRIDKVGCVTGLVPSAELKNEVQLFSTSACRRGTNCKPAVFDLKENRKKDSALFPYAGSDFGTGANFAFARQALVDMGGFDEALGAGAATGGGEDLDAFVGVLNNGWRLVYEPTGIVGHIHRSDVTRSTVKSGPMGPV